ncbi:hypothetical protein VFES401_15190 [Aliivibrio fischeri]|uniref:hypothetical protein n=1 Tax=Aliivibrio fischeri TaxID=668 RepID=UPI0007C5C3C6|nr:hypothetical protein [Aliivibrio fischeri]TGA68229.1 hypothetical protein VFES401_15190 [Aliivibrio fischeri]
MNVVDEVKKIDIDTATSVTLFFFSILAPGLLIMFLYKRNLFIELETLKLMLISLALGAPGVILPQFMSVVGASVCSRMLNIPQALLGNAKEWFYRHSINNAINLYLLIFVSYALQLKFLTFALMYIVSILFLSIYEIFYLARKAKNPDKFPPMDVE